MEKLRSTAKSMVEQGKWYVYHLGHNAEAKKLLNVVEAEKGRLDPTKKKLCIEYAKDVFGHSRYAPWLYVYTAYNNEFREGWIPDNYYGEVVLPKLNGKYGRICNRNTVINHLLNDASNLNLSYLINNIILDADLNIINENELKNRLFQLNEKIVYKLEESRKGEGIYFFDENSFDLDKIKALGNGVFQRFIEQHPFYTQFHENSVSTIRLTSICNDVGEIEVRAGYFRFGQGKDTHVNSYSQFRIPIIMSDGSLYKKAYFADTVSTDQIPGNKLEFSGMVLPEFKKCISKVKQMHSKIPFVRCIGWDIIVNKDNEVEIIEANGGHNGITFNEMVQGPCFSGLNWEKLRNA